MRMKKLPFYSLLSLSFFTGATLFAQVPTPAPAQKEAILIMGATAHLGNGQVIENSAIGFENGKLTLVADATTIRIDRTKYGKIYDAAGKHVYPGFIAPNTRLGLVEIDAARPTQDFSETGALNPNVRSIIAYNTDSEVTPTVRSNGVLLAQVSPTGGTVSGTSSVVQLDAWNWEDASYRADDGIHLNWPALRSWSGWQTGSPEMKKNEQYDKDVLALRQFFDEARAYAQAPVVAVKNPRFEAMRGLWDKKQNLFVHTDNAKTIQEAVLFAESYGLRTVLVGASDAWLVADFLKAREVPVILGRTQRLPSREDEDVDQPFKTPALLHEKGVLFAFSMDGAWQQRNLAFQAGQAAGYGLPKEAALSALTLHTAKILQIDKTCGSLETGKDATLFISEGDALDMRTCKVTAAFIQGREINLDNKQKRLQRRFEEKYRQ
ncbi:MAG: amidohydrolase family protein [Saprospiraceae bacterium]|nr:amidohydrolase family protein [Saprospiraceae bacterium]